MIGKQSYGGCFLQTPNRKEPDMTDDHNPPIPQGWRLEGLLCRGSCSSVYRVIRQSDGAHAALKVIPIPMDDSEIPVLRSKGYNDETISRILSNRLIEIFDKYDLLAKMNGESNIVSIGDVLYRRYPDGSGCTVSVLMEELTPLCDTLDYSFSEQRAIAIGCDLLKALEAYGRHRLVHGAIKPENVLVFGSGEYKLSDFGVSDLLGNRSLEIVGDACDFMAPEIFFGKEYDARADVYSIGLLLYWLCNDFRIPFLPAPDGPLCDKDFEDAVARRMSGGAMPEPKYGGMALKGIIARACAYDPKNRYSSASAMYRELSYLLVSGNVTVPAASIPIPQQTEQRLYAEPIVRERRQAQEQAMPIPEQNRRESSIVLFEDDFAEKRRAVPERVREKETVNKKRSSVVFFSGIIGLCIVAVASVVAAGIVLYRDGNCNRKDQKPGIVTRSPDATTGSETSSSPYAGTTGSVTPPSIVVWVISESPSAGISSDKPTVTPEITTTPTPSPTPTPTPTPVPTFVPVPSPKEAPFDADFSFDGQKAQDANYKCCYINPSWESFFSDIDEELISDQYRLMRNTKVTIRALYNEYALIETKDGRIGWVKASFLYAQWMHETTFNPVLTQQIADGLETPLSYEILGEFLIKTSKSSSNNLRKNPYVPEQLDPPMPDNRIMSVGIGVRFTLLAQRTIDGKKWYFCMKQASKGQNPVYCWVHESNFK